MMNESTLLRSPWLLRAVSLMATFGALAASACGGSPEASDQEDLTASGPVKSYIRILATPISNTEAAPQPALYARLCSDGAKDCTAVGIHFEQDTNRAGDQGVFMGKVQG